MDSIFVILTTFSVVIVAYQAEKNKNNNKKTLSYKISQIIANILNFIVFLDVNDVNNIINDIENKN